MKQEFVTLPRSVLEWALDAFETDDWQKKLQAAIALRAALEQTQNQSGGIPPNWKLVPVEPTRGMIEAGKDAHYEAEKRIQEPDAWGQGGFAKRAVRAAHVFQAMLDAAPQPPAPDQPQSDQLAMTPIAQRKLDSLLAEGYTISGYSIYHKQKHQHGFVTGAGLVGWWRPDGVEYPQPRGEQEPAAEHELKDVRCECCGYMTHHREHMGCIRAAHTKREPLPDEQIIRMVNQAGWDAVNLEDGFGERIRRYTEILEAAHNK